VWVVALPARPGPLEGTGVVPYAGLTERVLRCRSGVFERKVWSLVPPAGRPSAAILFLDAELYLDRVGPRPSWC
jgi:hypothetical protein